VLLHLDQSCRHRLCLQQHPIRWATRMGQSFRSKAATDTDMDMDMGGATTVVAATTTVGTAVAATTMVGVIIAIGGEQRGRKRLL
jgi:hypothetical protein